MVDPGAAQAIVRQLNRWYRQKAKPHGAMDHFYRGTRMSYTRTKRIVTCFMSLFMFLIGSAVWLIPEATEGRSAWFVLFLKIGGPTFLAARHNGTGTTL